MEPFTWQLPVKREEGGLQHPLSHGLRAMSAALPVLAEGAMQQQKDYFNAVVRGAAFHAGIRNQWQKKSLHRANSENED